VLAFESSKIFWGILIYEAFLKAERGLTFNEFILSFIGEDFEIISLVSFLDCTIGKIGN
jgi:hypothetical protein